MATARKRRRPCRKPQRHYAPYRALIGVLLRLGIPVKAHSVHDAARKVGSTAEYIRAMKVLVEANKKDLIAAVLAGRVSLLDAAAQVRFRALKKPRSLFQFLTWAGGLKPTPELHGILAGQFWMRMVNERGLSLDDARVACIEEGFLIDNEERAEAPTINDLLDLIAAEASGHKQYRGHETLDAIDYEAAKNYAAELSERGNPEVRQLIDDLMRDGVLVPTKRRRCGYIPRDFAKPAELPTSCRGGVHIREFLKRTA